MGQDLHWGGSCERGKLSVLRKPPTGREVSRDTGSFGGGRSQGCGGQSTEGPPGTAGQRRSLRGWAGAEARLPRADPGSTGLVTGSQEWVEEVWAHLLPYTERRGITAARPGKGAGCRRSILLCSCVLRQQSPRSLYPVRLPFQTEGDKEFLRQAKAKRIQHH